MILEEFELLTESQQLDLLYRDAVYIGKCTKGPSIAILLQYESFYVEVFYSRYRQNVRMLHFFTSPDKIDDYLEPIDIKNLS